MKFYVLSLLLIFSIIGCSSTDEIDTSSAEGAYKLGEKYRKDERYEDAIQQFQIVKNKFPYSRLATNAELQIADINYERETFIEAQNAYELFKELHPKHQKIDYVTFQLAMSFYKQLPESIDRDLTLAKQAILYFDEVITSFPSSEYFEKAKKRKVESRKKLGKKELYVADFYFIRDKFDSALSRYEGLLKKYGNLGLDEEALYGAALSAAHVKDEQKKGFYMDKLNKSFPNSKWTEKARKDLKYVK